MSDYREAKERYGLLFDHVREIVNAEDPQELIVIGAPEDEYDPEVGSILARLPNASSPADVGVMVAQVFDEWFGPELMGGWQPSEDMARSIWHVWRFRKLFEALSDEVRSALIENDPLGFVSAGEAGEYDHFVRSTMTQLTNAGAPEDLPDILRSHLGRYGARQDWQPTDRMVQTMWQAWQEYLKNYEHLLKNLSTE